ncbi:BTAD domain-containing putative transcriptional regulator [Mesorhizobium sp. ES1-6]|uniref:BTAD domain-containing putative transcriptional regulator n=1 Tax=Mesorhizobium sp. ES1-6 TaxID=2876626 RepID=UPI001CCC9EF6|nr:BTAD domain-containing putative transcriptional regulator [Mesorhizobium sp. ES1-6]MBZ9801076.1 SARP family transcriptional regulator [Mesorhizobium sp. ES1-6]
MSLESRNIICLLGVPEISNESEQAIFPTKGFQLLALLARAKSGRLTRKEAASFLWDSQSDAAALINLRQLISRMKRGLSGHNGVLAVGPQTIALGDDRLAVDLCRFEVRSQADDVNVATDALRLFRGELLEGADNTTDEFSHWLARERAALREDFMAAASKVLIELTRFGRASRANLDFVAAKMLALDPEREASYRTLVEAYGRNGMFDEAARVYQLLREMLGREHGVSPAPETAAVVRRVFSTRGAASLQVSQDATPITQPRIAFLAPVFPATTNASGLLKVFIEDVANELARFRSFLSLAPHSSFQIDHDSGMPVDNSVLRADYTISGFVKPTAGRSVLALRMVNCQSSEIVWSGEFPFDPVELFRSFNTLAVRIATSVGSAIERDRLTAFHRESESDAYLHYLDGQRLLANCDLAQLRRCRKSFKRSLDISPRFAPPRARIAQTLYLEWIQLGGNDPQLLNIAREQAEIAIEMDPNDALGHWVSGTVALYRREFDRCEDKLAEAEALCPNSADLLVQMADAKAHLGYADAGWQQFERAIDLNPTPPEHYWWAGASIAFAQEDYRKTIDLCRKLANEDSVLGMLSASHAFLGDLATARAYGSRIKELFAGSAMADREKVAPDRLDRDRQRQIEGLRLAGVE